MLPPTPKCYYARQSGKDGVVVMEDLTKSGYRHASNMDLIHCELVMKAIAKYHALTYNLKLKSQQLRDKFPMAFRNGYIPHACETLNKILKKNIKYLSSQTGQELNVEFLTKLQKNSTELMYLSMQAREPLATLCHGDLWANNIMFKYNGTEPIDVKLLDFQLGIYANPMTDVSYFLCTGTFPCLRSSHLGDLLLVYSKEFSSALETLGCVTPRGGGKEELISEYYSADFNFSFLCSFPFVQTVLTGQAMIDIDKDDGDLDDIVSKIEVKMEQNDDEFRQVVVGLVDEARRNGCLQQVTT